MNLSDTNGELTQQPDPEAPADHETMISQLTDERNSLQDQLLRTAAELQNFRRRAQQEKLQLRVYAIEEFVSDLLPVIDNFERTIAAVSAGATLESVVEGVKAIERQFSGILASHKVSRIPARAAPAISAQSWTASR